MQYKRSILIHRNKLFQNGLLHSQELLRSRISIGRQSHQLVFSGIDLESTVISKAAVQQSQGVWESYLLQYPYIFSLSGADRSSRPFPYSVDGQDGGLLIRRDIKSAGGMR